MQTKKTVLLYTLFFILGSWLLISCSDDTPTEIVPTDPISWQQNESFWGDRRIMLNSDSSDDTLTIAGLTLMSRFGPGDPVPNRTNLVSGDRTLNGQPAIEGIAMMYRSSRNSHTLIYHALDRAQCSGGGAGYPFLHSIDISDLDEFFKEDTMILGSSYERQLGAFNNMDQFLVVAQNFDPSGGPSVGLCLLDLNTVDTDHGFGSLCRELTPEALAINLNHEYALLVHMIESIGSNFFVSLTTTGRVFLRVEPNGVVETCQGIPFSVDDVFEFEGALWAFSREGHSLFRSENEGLNWDLISDGIPGFPHKFFELDEKLCFYVGSQLAWIDWDENFVHEVENLGLENVAITSAQVFDDQVWLTTLSGLFCKEVSEFFEVKADKNSSNLSGPLNVFAVHNKKHDPK